MEESGLVGPRRLRWRIFIVSFFFILAIDKYSICTYPRVVDTARTNSRLALSLAPEHPWRAASTPFLLTDLPQSLRLDRALQLCGRRCERLGAETRHVRRRGSG